MKYSSERTTLAAPSTHVGQLVGGLGSPGAARGVVLMGLIKYLTFTLVGQRFLH